MIPLNGVHKFKEGRQRSPSPTTFDRLFSETATSKRHRAELTQSAGRFRLFMAVQIGRRFITSVRITKQSLLCGRHRMEEWAYSSKLPTPLTLRRRVAGCLRQRLNSPNASLQPDN
ncbi:putative minor tail protein [Klebsiella phage vB_KshKPC-M]|nr:putative minor tail protein [Klebsiella phage vB_KshKPC-M]